MLSNIKRVDWICWAELIAELIQIVVVKRWSRLADLGANGLYVADLANVAKSAEFYQIYVFYLVYLVIPQFCNVYSK